MVSGGDNSLQVVSWTSSVGVAWSEGWQPVGTAQH